jgi:predicted Rossmann-fold nucleotide-binding protein
MEDIEKTLLKIQDNPNSQEINDILIELSKNPSEKSLVIVDYFLDSLNSIILNKIKLNLIFLIGVIGSKTVLNRKYLNFLVESYFNSDRWVRNEIIQSFLVILQNHEYNNEIYQIIEHALNEDYAPIKKSALSILMILKELPEKVVLTLLRILDTNNDEILEMGLMILKRSVQTWDELFELLNISKGYTILNKFIVRVLILEYFDSISELESFIEKINSSKWEEEYKILCKTEIKSFQRILKKKV